MVTIGSCAVLAWTSCVAVEFITRDNALASATALPDGCTGIGADRLASSRSRHDEFRDRSRVTGMVPMSPQLMVSLLVLISASNDARVIVGGSPEVRAALGAVGVGEATWSNAEMWVDSKLIVWVSKEPNICDSDVLEMARADPEFWLHRMAVLDLDDPADHAVRRLLHQQRIFMVKQSPGGVSCAWRMLEPGGDWGSVPVLKATRTIGSCSDMLDILKKLQVSAPVTTAVKATLQKPKSLTDCKR